VGTTTVRRGRRAEAGIQMQQALRIATPHYDAEQGVYDLDPGILDARFRADVKHCIEAQRAAAAEAVKQFRPHPGAADEVSEQALLKLLARGQDVHGIAKDRSISNVIVFGAGNIADSVRSQTVETLRVSVDQHADHMAQAIFPGTHGLVVGSSGHFWYPAGSYMAWHTNSGVPGWRVYINYAEEPGKSFFRYRDPQTGGIVTLWDKKWNIRLFRVTRDNPLWHAVYSDTNRFSLGYIIYQESWRGRLRQKLRRVF
jgi:hypothetical protein